LIEADGSRSNRGSITASFPLPMWQAWHGLPLSAALLFFHSDQVLRIGVPSGLVYSWHQAHNSELL